MIEQCLDFTVRRLDIENELLGQARRDSLTVQSFDDERPDPRTGDVELEYVAARQMDQHRAVGKLACDDVWHDDERRDQ